MSGDAVPPVYDPVAEPAAVAGLVADLTASGVAFSESTPLGAWTTLKVGGPAAIYAEPEDRAELDGLLAVLARHDVPLLVLGRGSNTVLSDEGFPGLVLRLGTGFKHIDVRRTDGGALVTAGGGEAMPAVASWVAVQGLGGLEFAAGIPASVGGSLRMNAGAHGGDMSACLVGAELAVVGEGTSTIAAGDLGLGYRRSSLPARSVVMGVTWLLADADPVAVRAELDHHRQWRRETQPLRERTCGSTFANPPGDSAGRLIEAAGGKGLRIGSARISEKHANFVCADPGGRASDVWALVTAARQLVFDASGVWMEPEVRLVGHFT